MATINNLEDLKAWQEARKLCIGIYKITETFPKDEKYNITKHLRESGRGVVGNIGEGFGRYFYKESAQFYNIAKGCLGEIKSDIYLSFDLKYIKSEDMLNRFIRQVSLVNNKIGGLIVQSLRQFKK